MGVSNSRSARDVEVLLIREISKLWEWRTLLATGSAREQLRLRVQLARLGEALARIGDLARLRLDAGSDEPETPVGLVVLECVSRSRRAPRRSARRAPGRARPEGTESPPRAGCSCADSAWSSASTRSPESTASWLRRTSMFASSGIVSATMRPNAIAATAMRRSGRRFRLVSAAAARSTPAPWPGRPEVRAREQR